jgi:hypothetical protein
VKKKQSSKANNLMQNDENEKKSYKKIEEKNLSQPRLTRLTHHTRHEIGIKKIDLKKRANKNSPS